MREEEQSRQTYHEQVLPLLQETHSSQGNEITEVHDG